MTSQPPELPYVLSSHKTALDRIEATFPSYLKLRSICWLLRQGVRSTEGLVISSALPANLDLAHQYAISRGWDRYLLRHDSHRGNTRFLQGGFLVNTNDLDRWLARFTHDGICMLLDPLDPLFNGYNISCLLDTSSALIEIVGPGFDASDLQRGQVRPHESFSFNIKSSKFQRHTLCTDAEYQNSISDRLRKIWWKFRHHEPDPRRWTDLTQLEIQACWEYIRARGATLPDVYTPISPRVLGHYGKIARPLANAWQSDLNDLPAVLAASFVQDGSLRFWDLNTAVRWTR
jgi:hypothetical protein